MTKIRVILLSVFALFFLIGGIGWSEEQSGLEQKVEELEKTNSVLQEKMKALEDKQKAQEKKVETLRKKPSAASVVSDALSKKVNIGGHFKLFLADYADGERNNVDQNNNLSAGVNELWLFIRKPLNDWLVLDVTPTVRVAAGATPRIGSDISKSSSSDVDVELDEAYMTVRLPHEVEMRAGAIYPYFSEDYASKVWWHETYHANNGLVELENWQSSGIEFYRAFNFENFSLPVYFYPYLNGVDRGRTNDSRFTDNNSDKNLLAHIAPSAYLLGGRFRFLGSLGWGKWDDDGDKDSWQYALGADYVYQGISIMGEYMSKAREDWEISEDITRDADDEGWYVRLMYTFNPKWRVLVKYSDVDLFSPSDERMLTDNYKTTAFAVNYWLTDGSTIIPQVEYVDSERSDDSETLEYFRYTLGWRTTF
ncbi:MAG: porin [Desulfosalsimonadaceae bacterium]|nr:porin [Desulfosalsimonadaceae bacterium]